MQIFIFYDDQIKKIYSNLFNFSMYNILYILKNYNINLTFI